MEPTTPSRLPIYVFSPYIRFLGGGEKYLAGALSALQSHHEVNLICRESEAMYVSKMSSMFGIDLRGVHVVTGDVRSEQDLARHVPKRSCLFQVSNGVPLSIPCHRRILHVQIKYPRLDDAHARRLFADGSAAQANGEIARRFDEQDCIVFPSAYVRDFMIPEWNLDASRCMIINPSVSSAFFFNGRADVNSRIISVGRFEPIKKQSAQLDLVESLRGIAPDDFRLTMIGSSRTQLAQALEDRARNLPVDFRYGLDVDEMAQAYRASSILWSTTGLSVSVEQKAHTVESFGLAVAEAMACGCVPIAIDAGGVREVIEHGKNGFLVNNLEEMALVTLELLNNAHAHSVLSKAARDRALRFSFAEFVRQYRDIFESCT